MVYTVDSKPTAARLESSSLSPGTKFESNSELGSILVSTYIYARTHCSSNPDWRASTALAGSREQTPKLPPPTPPREGEKRKGSFCFVSSLIYLFSTAANRIDIILGKVSIATKLKKDIFLAIETNIERVF